MDERVLFVEDDPSIREVTSLGLRGTGLRVDTAADGREGLERFRAEPYDVVVLDALRGLPHSSVAPSDDSVGSTLSLDSGGLLWSNDLVN